MCSNLCKRIAKAKKLSARQRAREIREGAKFELESYERLYTSFNIFTRDGENLTVTSPRPMTLYEAQYYFKALSISGNI